MHFAYDTLGVALSMPSFGPVYVTISRTREDASSSQCCLCFLEHGGINCAALCHGEGSDSCGSEAFHHKHSLNRA